MAIFELHSRMVLPEFGNGIKEVQEFFLVEFIWDSMEGSYVENTFSIDTVIYDLKHLRNYISKHGVSVGCPNTELAFSPENLPANKQLKFL